jgi:NAD(P)-dependent dehydrogenase (short-subunit alcohol dehydrogenase family)
MDLGLNGHVAVVTGGASNIGRAISHQLAAEGAVVAILDRDAEMAASTAREIT